MLRFSRYPYKSYIGKLLKIILPRSLVIPVLQGELRGKKWIIGSSNMECVLGTYEHEKAKLFSKMVTNGRIAYDIGAHVGYYTLLASNKVGPTGIVIAFEPLPQNLSYLKRHVQMNRCSNVSIIEAAVSNKKGVHTFQEGAGTYTGRLCDKGVLKVNTVCIDDLVTDGKIPPPNFVKIDVEGAEFDVLIGAKSTLISYKPELFLATHGHEVHNNCVQFLKTIGYKIEPINRKDLSNASEIYAYCNYLYI